MFEHHPANRKMAGFTFRPVHLQRSGDTVHHRLVATLAAITLLLLPAAVFSQGQGSATGGFGASGAAPSGTLRAVGNTVNGAPAGTSGTNPGVPSPAANNTATPAATSGTTLRPVGTNVDGSVAGTSGTDPGSQTLSNPLNRNPVNRTSAAPDVAPPTDASNSTSRPTEAAATAPDNRDTLVTTDPSRDSAR
ncbi:MAG: hypothetical protein V4614_04540 [Pseudomonadota bacterium]